MKFDIYCTLIIDPGMRIFKEKERKKKKKNQKQKEINYKKGQNGILAKKNDKKYKSHSCIYSL